MKFKKYCITRMRSTENMTSAAEDASPSVYLEFDDGSIKVFFPSQRSSERENNIIATTQKKHPDWKFEQFSSSNLAYFVEDRGTYSPEKEAEINEILSGYGYPTE